MEGIQRALVISILSRGWAAGLALLAVPLYLRMLGVEAYGVVGLFTSFSILVGFLDLGLGATLTRELSGLTARTVTLADGRDLLRTFELAYTLIALLIGLIVVLCSGPVAQYWLKAQMLERSDIGHALALAGVALACQWPTNLYSAGLVGLHKQVQLGFVTIVFATFRVVFSLAALYWSSSLNSFFWAQIITMLLQTLCIRWLVWRAMKLVDHRPRPRLSIIRSSVQFAKGVTGITITGIILTQVDKLILSKSLSLPDYGIYVLASTLATGLFILISPMFLVFYPRFSSLIHAGDSKRLIALYHLSSQAMAALIIPISLVVAIFPQEILYIWTGDSVLSHQAALILSCLIIGNAFNGILVTPYALQLAFGWTKLALFVNLFGILTIVPLIFWSTTTYGAIGGAACWVLLTLLSIILTPQIMHRHLLTTEKIAWYSHSVVYPLTISLIVFISFRQISLENISRFSMGLTLICYWIIGGIIVLACLPQLRSKLFNYFRT